MIFDQAVREIEKNSYLLRNPTLEKLREMALEEKGVQETRDGSICFYSRIMGRSAKHTQIVTGAPTKDQEETVQKVIDHLKGKRMIRLDRMMGTQETFLCRSYAPYNYPHILLMWGSMLFDWEQETGNEKPDFNTVQVPDWPETKIIADGKTGITFILGSDYTGEMKKANLRMAMHRTKEKGGLGLHAGSKVLKVKNGEGVVERGVLLFGLSATGKTTLTCHHHWLDKENGEGVIIKQDDVVLMQKDSFCAGTEDNFYIKTDGLEEKSQPVLYKAALSNNALFENVKLFDNGKIDFFDNSITSNGRAVICRKDMPDTDDSIDIKKADMVLFITRRNTIVPPVAKLTTEQGAAFFMLGESVGSSASDVDPGKPRRVVGTNPFIIGSKDEEGNRFYDLLKKNPNVDCYILNTGKIGMNEKSPGEKITVKDSTIIMREIARGTVKWRKHPFWGYEVLDDCPGVDISKFHPDKFYTKEQYQQMLEELRKERREWLSQFNNLYSEIKNAI